MKIGISLISQPQFVLAWSMTLKGVVGKRETMGDDPVFGGLCTDYSLNIQAFRYIPISLFMYAPELNVELVVNSGRPSD